MTTIIRRLTLPMVNSYWVKTNDLQLLVDTGMETDFAALRRFVQQQGSDLSRINYIVHTHGHVDHCGCTALLANKYGIKTIVHQGDLDKVRQGSNGLLRPTNITSRLLLPFTNKGFAAFEPDIVLTQATDLSQYLPTVQALHTPGHTDGSISLLFDTGEAIIGDVIRGGHMGGRLFPHKPRYHYYLNSYPQIHQSIQAILQWQAQRYHVGHGGYLTAQAIQQAFGARL